MVFAMVPAAPPAWIHIKNQRAISWPAPISMIVPYFNGSRLRAKAFSMVLSGASDMSALIYQNAMVPAPRLELGRPYGQGDFKSLASTNSAKRAHDRTLTSETGRDNPQAWGDFLIRLP